MSCEELAGVVSAGALVVGALVAGGEQKFKNRVEKWPEFEFPKFLEI